MSWKERFEARGSALCVGLDPVVERLPAGYAAGDFCEQVVDTTADLAACYKANMAFFEKLAPNGWDQLRKLCDTIRQRGIPVLLDAKRGDIGSTAQAYAEAYFGGPFDCDAMTVNPSVGLDACEPFRTRAREMDRGVFLLLRTSNPGAAMFQEAAEPVLIEAIRGEPAFGAVVGATDPETGARLREALPHTLFLVPGFGAQGGTDLRPFFDADGKGAIVNSSRGIMYAGEGQDWAARKDAIRDAAKEAYATIERARKA